MKKFFVFIGIFFQWTWKLLSTSCSVVSNLFFLVVLIVILSLFFEPKVEVPDGSALLLAPSGNLVEEKTVIDPLSRFVNGFAGFPLPEETLLQDILDTIDAAAGDERIKILVLRLNDLNQGSLNQFKTIGQKLISFKQSGKKIIAFGDQFTQGHYYLASYADEIYLNPMGGINLWGFGVFRLYLKDLIDKLAINFHVFRVGSFKSALEPFTRTNMSAEARSSNQQWLNRVWDLFCQDIGQNRNMSPDFIPNFINDMSAYMKQAGGDSARMAQENDFIDGIMTKAQANSYLISLVGRSDDTKNFRHIHFLDYLRNLSPSYLKQPKNHDGVAIIVATGNIIQGKTVPGQISSEGLGNLIREARKNKHVKALVLRINSGGGSAFASEQIRQELLLLQKSGKPVVISMGSLAASGAYWIAATADKIYASPFTITGSIGIYGMIPTFENSIAKVGVASDGVGTTKIAAAGDPTQALPSELTESIQLSVEEGYRKFVNIVAEGRNMPLEDVEKIAQGRVWDGAKAKQLGLVDELGGLAESIQAAAEIAGLKKITPFYLQQNTSPAQNLFAGSDRWSIFSLLDFHNLTASSNRFIQNIRSHLKLLEMYDDPANIYAHSMIPLTFLSL